MSFCRTCLKTISNGTICNKCYDKEQRAADLRAAESDEDEDEEDEEEHADDE